MVFGLILAAIAYFLFHVEWWLAVGIAAGYILLAFAWDAHRKSQHPMEW